MLSACSGDNPAPPVEVDLTPATVMFSISLDNPNGNTRADDDWQGPYEEDEGYDFDLALSPTAFYPVIYKVKEDKTLENFMDVTPMALIELEPGFDGATRNFAFTGKIPVEQGKTDFETLKASADKFRMVVYANEYYPSGSTIDENCSFERIGNGGKPGFYGVPMWGVTEFKFNTLREGEALILPQISLLRSMAMVRVQLNNPKAPGSDTPQDVKLVSLKMSRYNSQGYIAPGNWNKLSNTTNLKFDDTPNFITTSESQDYIIKVGSEVAEDGKSPYMVIEDGAEVYHRNSTVKDDMICFYLPEVANKNDDQLLLEVSYTLNGGKIQTAPLYFCRYTSSGPIDPGDNPPMVPKGSSDNGIWHIVRNHIYEFTITGVQDSKITVEARVKDWQYHKSSVDLEE